MSDEFDWINDEDIVVQPRSGIAIYENDAGDIVIRQEALPYQDGDPFIVIPRDQVGLVIDRLFSLGKPARSSQ